MDDHRIAQPFHAGELRAQGLAGGGPAGAPVRSRMPDQHRAFFPLLPFLCAAVADGEGWPLATLLQGEPGFVSAPDAGRLDIAALPPADDPAAPWIAPGADIGLLGIDLSTRRRNRANGTVAARDDDGLSVAVRQSFGNCPKYIRVRDLRRHRRARGDTLVFAGALPPDAAALVACSETMFVATASGASAADAARGLDISHRGGPAGFVRVDGDTLAVPDYAGNRYFNTLGNLLLEPRASLLFIDFGSGDLLQLQGTAQMHWDARASDAGGADGRRWTFRSVRGWLRRAAFAWGG